jgi:hypothetical protein
LEKKISYYNNFSKSKFTPLNIQDRFELIYNENYWESDESRSGLGSEIKNTKEVLKALKKIIKEYNIRSIIDIPCGDFNWMSKIDMKNIDYKGFDIVRPVIIDNNKKFKKNNINFYNSDITTSRLAKGDLMFVRDCLVHFSFEDITKSIFRIKQSGSKYLMSTSFVNLEKNIDIYSADWRPINLEKDPFNFPKPIVTINEKCQEMNGIYADKSICLWEINKIPCLS